jgi:hypothetical protein
VSANVWVFYLSILVAALGVVGAIFGARAGTPMPHDKETWDGVSAFEVAFRKARKRDGLIVTASAMLTSAAGAAIAVISRVNPN